MNHQIKQKSCFEGILSSCYVFLLFTVFPLAVHHGYIDILQVKTNIFYFISGTYIILMCCVLVHKSLKKTISLIHWHNFSSDYFVAGYFVVIFCSWFLCSEKKDQFWGIHGRNMGLLTIVFCLLIYMLISNFLQFSQYILLGLLTAASLVNIISLCNHLGFDPLSMYPMFDSESDFISTMGNLNTLSAYISLLLPFGMTLFCVSKNRLSKIIYGFFCFTGFFGITVSNSDSAYLAVGTSFFILLIWGKKKENGISLAILLFLYSVSILILKLLRSLRGEEYCMDIRNGLPKIMMDFRINMVLLLLCCFLLFTFYTIAKYKKDTEKFWKYLRKWMIIGIVVFIILIVLFIIYINLQWKSKEAKVFLGSFYRYFYFSNSWGTYRLRIWRAALKIYGRFPLFKKFIGAGPAGFYFAAQQYLTEKELGKFQNQGILIDSHNVYLQILIVSGIIGLILFLGIFITSFFKFCKIGKTEHYMLAFAMLEIAFLIQAFVNNPHIYIDPLVFALTAVGNNLCKKKGEHVYESI